jgi:hypothetical protein
MLDQKSRAQGDRIKGSEKEQNSTSKLWPNEGTDITIRDEERVSTVALRDVVAMIQDRKLRAADS